MRADFQESDDCSYSITLLTLSGRTSKYKLLFVLVVNIVMRLQFGGPSNVVSKNAILRKSYQVV